MCRSNVDIQSVATETRRGKKRKIERKKPQDENIYGLPQSLNKMIDDRDVINS